jgi:MazG family protein
VNHGTVDEDTHPPEQPLAQSKSRSRVWVEAGAMVVWEIRQMHKPETAGDKFETLVGIMARLRARDGCPWDQKQTYDTIKGYLLEETYEVLDAIDQRDWPGLCEELGDLLLQPVFFAQMATEEGKFSITDALDAINNKLTRRHPHVFAEGDAKTAEDVKRRWDEIKAEEKLAKGEAEPESILANVPRALPALVEAEKISAKASSVGFDWTDVAGAVNKVCEEATELNKAREDQHAEAIEDELGDLFFSLVNVARMLRIDPEQALRKANGKFRRRFVALEQAVVAEGGTMQERSLDQLESMWQRVKLGQSGPASDGLSQ